MDALDCLFWSALAVGLLLQGCVLAIVFFVDTKGRF